MKINGLSPKIRDDICDCLKNILEGLEKDNITLYTDYGNGITLVCREHDIELSFDQYIGTGELYFKNINWTENAFD